MRVGPLVALLLAVGSGCGSHDAARPRSDTTTPTESHTATTRQGAGQADQGSGGQAMPAQSKTQNFFISPSGNIGCELDHQVVRGTADRAYCQTFSPARSVTLSSDGRIKMCTGHGCIGNGPENAYTLPYGSSTGLGPFRCVSRPTGMTCTAAAADAGFEISRAGVRELRR